MRARLGGWGALAVICAGLQSAPAAASGTFNLLTYISGSTTKVEQLIGDHDWADTLKSVRSLTVTKADVLGNDIGASFMDGDSLIMLFGDTIGASQQYVPRWASPLDTLKWNARDPIAWSTTSNPDSALLLHFFKSVTGDSALIVAPQYPNGSMLPMGADNVPNDGITLDGKLYLICKSGTRDSSGTLLHDTDSSVVVRFHPIQKTFDAGRTVSRIQDRGEFLTTCARELPAQFAAPGDSEVLIFGLGIYRQSDIYLSKIPRADFVSGVDGHGASATRYFAGFVNGQPTWSDSASRAYPIVQDDPLTDIGVGPVQQPWPNDTPTIGNFSVILSPSLSLWLMTYDGGRQPGHYPGITGVYFTSALTPWGPWQKPQLIFNSTRDGAQGVYIHHYDHSTDVGTGPAGPTIGDQKTNDPDTTNGGMYAPGILEPFVRTVGDTLIVDYTLSTWNPYTIVRMRSKFLVSVEPLSVGSAPWTRPGAESSPNPFHTSTLVTFAMPRAGSVEVRVFDLEGREVRHLLSGSLAAGPHRVTWDGRSDRGVAVKPGVYLVRIRAPGADFTSRVARLE